MSDQIKTIPDNGIAFQKKVLTIPPEQWKAVLTGLSAQKLLSPKEIGILQVALQIPRKIPGDKQAAVLLMLLDRAKAEGIVAGE